MSESVKFGDLENATPPAPPVSASDEPAAEPAETTEQEATPGAAGRPRPTETIERDAKVLDFMTQANKRFTKAELVDGTGLPANQVYLSLYRLGKVQGLVEREGRTWAVVGKDYPAPVEAAPAEATDETASAE